VDHARHCRSPRALVGVGNIPRTGSVIATEWLQRRRQGDISGATAVVISRDRWLMLVMP
jgi:hypothetical protein